MMRANQRIVSRLAGQSRRVSNSRIFSRGTGEAYQFASASPRSIARAESLPTRL